MFDGKHATCPGHAQIVQRELGEVPLMVPRSTSSVPGLLLWFWDGGNPRQWPVLPEHEPAPEGMVQVFRMRTPHRAQPHEKIYVWPENNGLVALTISDTMTHWMLEYLQHEMRIWPVVEHIQQVRLGGRARAMLCVNLAQRGEPYARVAGRTCERLELAAIPRSWTVWDEMPFRS